MKRLRAASALVCFALASCLSEMPVPPGPRIASGTYVLTRVGGMALPALTRASENLEVVLTEGSLVVTDDLRATRVLRYHAGPIGGPYTQFAHADTATFTIGPVNEGLILRRDPAALEVPDDIATVAGTSIRVRAHALDAAVPTQELTFERR